MRYEAVPGCLAAPVGSSTMVLLPTMEYLELDEVGAAIFEQVRSAASVDDVVTALSTVYTVDRATLQRDVAEYLEMLVERGAVERRDPT